MSYSTGEWLVWVEEDQSDGAGEERGREAADEGGELGKGVAGVFVGGSDGGIAAGGGVDWGVPGEELKPQGGVGDVVRSVDIQWLWVR